MVDGRRGEETTPQGCGGDLCKYNDGVEEEPEPGRGCRVKSVGVAYKEPALVVAPGSFFRFHLSLQTVDTRSYYLCSSFLLFNRTDEILLFLFTTTVPEPCSPYFLYC